MKKIFISLLLITQLAMPQDQRQQEPKKIESPRNEQTIQENADNGLGAILILANLAALYMCYRAL